MVIVRFVLFSLMLCNVMSAYAAIAPGTVWEFQTGGAANNADGFGFNPTNASPGTDYTLNAGKYNGTDLVTTNGTTNPCIVHTTSSHLFTTADQGNIIHINSGGSFIASYYEIVTADGTNATLDRACATIASTSGGTYHVGGQGTFGSDTAFLGNFPLAGNTMYIKSGNFTVSAANTSTISGTATSYINIIGYQNNRTDNPTGSNRPSIALSANAWTLVNFFKVSNIIVSGTASVMLTVGTRNMMNNVKLTNTSASTGRSALIMGAGSMFLNSEAISYNGNAVNTNGNNMSVIGSYLHDSDTCLTTGATTNAMTVINNIFDSCFNRAINHSAAMTSTNEIYGNTFFGGITNKTGTGVNGTTTGDNATHLYNNIFYGLATAVNTADANNAAWYGDYNDFNNNTADNTNYTKGSNDVNLDPQFISVGQYTGTNASTSGTTLTDSGANFANVVNNRDFVYVSATTGGTTGVYAITGHTGTTLTTDNSLGTGSAVHYQVTYGHNFGVGSNVAGKGFPGTITPGLSTAGSMTLGALQPSYTDPGIANVLSTVTYTFGNTSMTGTYVAPTTGQVQTGVSFGNSQTGTYDGSDRWTDPGIANVKDGVAYKANSTTNNRTGTLLNRGGKGHLGPRNF